MLCIGFWQNVSWLFVAGFESGSVITKENAFMEEGFWGWIKNENGFYFYRTFTVDSFFLSPTSH